MKVKSVLCAFLLSLLPLLLAGCGKDEELTEWAAGKANDALEAVGGGVQEVIDNLEMPSIRVAHLKTTWSLHGHIC